MRQLFRLLFLLLALFGAWSALHAEEDDETLSLSPVKKAAGSVDTPAPTPVPVAPTVMPTPAPTPLPTEQPTPRPTPQPTPRPTPQPKIRAAVLRSLEVKPSDEGVRVTLRASGPISGACANLSNPERVLIKVSGATLAGSVVPRRHEVNLGTVQRVRLATKSASELWAVVDLSARTAFQTRQPAPDTFEIVLVTGAAAAEPAAPRATLPRINLMLFDQNVVYQDKQYERFPCANFIYNESDAFPLKRQFISTLVFYHGYGAFVGNVRIMDPHNKLLAQTEQPFAFNLFNKLTDFMVELPWDVTFKEKGTYTLILALNGADVLKHSFYVGHNRDTPPND
jgi:hypothetical protein